MSETPFLSCADVTLSIGTSFRLEHLDLKVSAGDWIEITGHNRSGKSSLLNMIYGLAWPESGRIIFEGKDIISPESVQALRRRVGFVSDALPLVGGRTLRANFSLSATSAGWPAFTVPDGPLQEVLDAFQLTERMLDQPDHFSQSEMWLARTARAMIAAPVLLMLDCPLRSLDDHFARVFLGTIRKYSRDTGCAVIWCEDRLTMDPPSGRRTFVIENQLLKEVFV